MPLGIDFFRIFSDFWLLKSSHVGSKMYKKSILSCKGRKAEKHYKTCIILINFEVQGIEKSNKNRSKTHKKWMQDGDSSWHRFFMDFRRFSEASWSQVGSKNRLKICEKSRKFRSWAIWALRADSGTLQNASGTASGRPIGSSWPPSWLSWLPCWPSWTSSWSPGTVQIARGAVPDPFSNASVSSNGVRIDFSSFLFCRAKAPMCFFLFVFEIQFFQTSLKDTGLDVDPFFVPVSHLKGAKAVNFAASNFWV